jgi:hypothetical protein
MVAVAIIAPKIGKRLLSSASSRVGRNYQILV